MSTSAMPGVRRSIADIQADYDAGHTAELDNLMRAWKGIKELPPTDPNSFFMIGGYHGEPFRGDGETNPQWWGGYCQHGTVLFPTWHRAYLWRLEQALQSIPGCETVMLPFWDECSADSQSSGIPRALTDEFYTLDGQQIDNPLRSFVLPVDIVDQVTGDDAMYTKPAGYETVRYPLSGLVGTPADQAATAAHNALYPDYGQNVGILNGNIVNWLTTSFVLDGNPFGLIYNKFINCLNAPNYTLFSNTTSQRAWNNANPHNLVTALESPHNSVHLAVGGFDVPGFNASPIAGANGDMGENDTAGLDPIFYFHHCFIDYVLWTWQKRHGATTSFTIDPTDPGSVYVLGGNNSPPAGADPNAPITMQTALDPFTRTDGTPFTSDDVIDIETQLGYTYGPASLDSFAQAAPAFAAEAVARPAGKTLHVAGLDRAKIRGSFIIAVHAEIDGEPHVIGHEAVLSRWHVEGCANCQNHLGVSADFKLPDEASDANAVRVEIRTRANVPGPQPVPPGAKMMSEAAFVDTPAYTVEIR